MTEYLSLTLTRCPATASSVTTAIAHLNEGGSHHTNRIDHSRPWPETRSCVASTRSDGFRYGLGAEVRISTRRAARLGACWTTVGLEGRGAVARTRGRSHLRRSSRKMAASVIPKKREACDASERHAASAAVSFSYVHVCPDWCVFVLNLNFFSRKLSISCFDPDCWFHVQSVYAGILLNVVP